MRLLAQAGSDQEKNSAADSLSKRLRQDFNAARFGHYFRTSTMLNTATLNREWLYAVQDPHDCKCIVMKVQENENGQEDTRFPVKENMAFIDALNYLSRFENTSLNPSTLPLDDKETALLGDTHFNAFANREGLIRDRESGEYFPTLNGHAISKGVFNHGDLARTMQHAQTPPAQTEKFMIPGHINPVRVTGSIDRLVKLYKTLDRIQYLSACHAALAGIIDYTLKARPRTDYYYSGSFDRYKACSELYQLDQDFFSKISDDFENKKHTSYKKPVTGPSGLTNKITNYMASKLLPEGPPDDGRISTFTFFSILNKLKTMPLELAALKDEHQKILDCYEAAYEFSLCRHYSQQSLTESDIAYKEREDYTRLLTARLERLDNIAERTGLDPVMKASLRASVHGKTLPGYFQDIENFRSALNACEKEARSDADTARRSLTELAP